MHAQTVCQLSQIPRGPYLYIGTYFQQGVTIVTALLRNDSRLNASTWETIS